MDRYEGVVGEQEALEAGEVREDVRGEEDEAVVGEVQTPQGAQGAPAQRGGQVHHRGVVVKSPAEVQIQQGVVLHHEGFGVDDRQLVVAQVQRAEAAQPRKRVGIHLGYSGFEGD